MACFFPACGSCDGSERRLWLLIATVIAYKWRWLLTWRRKTRAEKADKLESCRVLLSLGTKNREQTRAEKLVQDQNVAERHSSRSYVKNCGARKQARVYMCLHESVTQGQV